VDHLRIEVDTSEILGFDFLDIEENIAGPESEELAIEGIDPERDVIMNSHRLRG
jgi:hypothetical protein